MPPSEPPPPASTAKGPPSGFGKGFVLDSWYFVALSRDVAPGSLKRHEVMGEPVLIGRTRPAEGATGTVFALRDICPHRAAPLSAGRIVDRPGEGQTVECPYHGWRFGTDGRCAAIPSLVEDQPETTNRIRVRSWPVAESQGMVFVFMRSDPRDDTAPDHDPPVFPGIVGGEAKRVEAMDFDRHIDHAVVSLMDPAHGRSGPSMPEEIRGFAPDDPGVTLVRDTPETGITFRLPGYGREHIRLGKRQVLVLTCLTPVNETRTRITRIFWSDHGLFRLARPFLKPDGGRVTLQDRSLRHDPARIGTDDADPPASWYLPLKHEWAQSRAEQRPFVNPVEPVTLRRNR